MKGKILIIAMIFISFSAFAQEWQDVLYLKNGSVIRGVLIEQIPNVSVKIQTSDGSVFVYEMGDVEKMAKEQKQKTEKEKKTAEKLKYPNYGYRCILSGAEVFIHSVAEGFSLSMIHGMQITPKIFVGGGLGIQRIKIYDDANPNLYTYGCIPIFTNMRYDMVKGSFSPFMDLRLGLQFGGLDGFYFSPSVGCRFGHFNLSLGVETKQCIYHEKKQKDWGFYETQKSITVPTLRLAFDMGAR